jgi:hypothetical protein
MARSGPRVEIVHLTLILGNRFGAGFMSRGQENQAISVLLDLLANCFSAVSFHNLAMMNRQSLFHWETLTSHCGSSSEALDQLLVKAAVGLQTRDGFCRQLVQLRHIRVFAAQPLFAFPDAFSPAGATWTHPHEGARLHLLE